MSDVKSFFFFADLTWLQWFTGVLQDTVTSLWGRGYRYEREQASNLFKLVFSYSLNININILKSNLSLGLEQKH